MSQTIRAMNAPSRTQDNPESTTSQNLPVTLMGGVFSLWGAVVAGFLYQFLPALLTTGASRPTG